MRPTYMHRIIGLLLFLNLFSFAHAKENPAPYALSGGCITSAAQYLVNGGIPATITATVAGGGSCTSYSYQWQRSTDNVYFTDIPGATGQNLPFTATLPSTQATWFQRKTTCGNETAYTGSIAVNMIVKFFYNTADSVTKTRNNCTQNGTPTAYTYVVRANKYSSPVSQADADAKADKDLADSAQYYANLRGLCLWYNVEKKDTLNRSDCGSGFGSTYIYIVGAKKYSSAVNQADADAKAQKDLTDSAQYYANRMGVCTWYNVARDSTTTKKDCPAGTTPTSYKYIVAARKYSSTISQADADAKANKDIKDSTQLKANANALCNNMFITVLPGGTSPNYFTLGVKNAAGTVVYQKTFMDGGSMLPFAVALPASSGYTIDIGSPDHMYAIVNGTQKEMRNSSVSWFAGAPVNITVSSTPLYYSNYVSDTYITSCPQGYVGSAVTIGISANKYTSPVSQDDADALAKKELSDSGQVRANRTGTCTLAQLVNITLSNYFPGTTNPLVTSVSFIKEGVVVQTNSFPGTATGSATVTLPAGTYTMMFNAPGAPVGMPLGWNLRPQNYFWSKPTNSTTITTQAVTFVYGTAYTIQANRDL